MQSRKQVPTTAENWLYKDMGENPWERYFTKLVYHPKGDPDWEECINEYKEEWEREHPAPETEQPTE